MISLDAASAHIDAGVSLEGCCSSSASSTAPLPWAVSARWSSEAKRLVHASRMFQDVRFASLAGVRADAQLTSSPPLKASRGQVQLLGLRQEVRMSELRSPEAHKVAGFAADQGEPPSPGGPHFLISSPWCVSTVSRSVTIITQSCMGRNALGAYRHRRR